MLIILGGLPGTGKTTLARALASTLQATHLRIDTIEQALRETGLLPDDMGPTGYQVAYAQAWEWLSQGNSVIADSVNPIELTRKAWRNVARAAGCAEIELEVVCSDRAEHQRRVETRTSDIAGLKPPTWQQVVNRHYEPWLGMRAVIDTAGHTEAETLAQALERITVVQNRLALTQLTANTP